MRGEEKREKLAAWEREQADGEGGPRGVESWCWARRGRRERFLFFFFFYFKTISKSNLNHFVFWIKTTHYKNTNAPACMHNHVSKPYDEFYFNEKLLFPIFYEHKNT